MRSDQHLDLAFGEVAAASAFCSAVRSEPRDHLHAHGKVAVAVAEGVPVLLGEDRRRREHHHLLAVHRRSERGADGDLRLAEADVAADEPIHRTRRLEVLLHLLDRALLIGRLAVRERRFEPLQPLVPEVVRIARRLLPLRVEREQLARELADRRARARLEVLPRLAAELRERGRRCVGADVSRHLADLLVRDVQAVVTAKREQQVVARDAGDCLRLEAEQLADAVVLVHDVVAGAQVGERLKRSPDARGLRPARALAEELRVGQQDEVQVAPHEAAARRRDGESRLRLLRQRLAALEQRRVDAAKQVLGAQRIAAVRERDDHAVAGAHERVQLVLGLRQSARGERRTLRLERERLARRQLVELRRAAQADRPRDPPPPRPAAPGPAPRRGRGRPAARGRDRREPSALVVLQVDPPLCGGVDHRIVDGMKRALRERRERAHLLDLVAEELDAQRLAAGRRKDVDEPAADGELPAVLGPLDALVAGERERLGQLLDADLLARMRCGSAPDDWARAASPRRSPSPTRRRARRRSSTSSARARSPTRCGGGWSPESQRTPRLGSKPGVLLAEEPRRGLGEVARVGVLRNENRQRAAELLVQRRDDERQRRLGDAGAGRQRRRELLQPLGLRAARGRARRARGVVRRFGP